MTENAPGSTAASANYTALDRGQPVTEPVDESSAESVETETVNESDYSTEAVGAEAARAQHAEDVQFHQDNPNTPLVRAANPDVGGE
jgi:hypothetical protein